MKLYKVLGFVFLILILWQSTSAAKTEYDFDGDGKTDPVVWRGDSSTFQRTWYILRSRDGFFAIQWGTGSTTFDDRAVPEDYDGDGKWDVAVWRRRIQEEGQSYFYIFLSQTNTFQAIPWGLRFDSPIPKDYDGDGKADIAVTRGNSSGLTWYIMQSRDGLRIERFGLSGDVPIRGDYDGDGRGDLALYRRDVSTFRGNYTFYFKRSSDGAITADNFGYEQADFVVPGDYDGDGKTDIAVWRGQSEFGNGTWYWHRSSDGGYEQVRWGTVLTPDYPVPGDYDGDGKTDVAVYRRGGGSCGATGTSCFHINGSQTGFMAIQWGSNADASIR